MKRSEPMSHPRPRAWAAAAPAGRGPTASSSAGRCPYNSGTNCMCARRAVIPSAARQRPHTSDAVQELSGGLQPRLAHRNGHNGFRSQHRQGQMAMKTDNRQVGLSALLGTARSAQPPPFARCSCCPTRRGGSCGRCGAAQGPGGLEIEISGTSASCRQAASSNWTWAAPPAHAAARQAAAAFV